MASLKGSNRSLSLCVNDMLMPPSITSRGNDTWRRGCVAAPSQTGNSVQREVKCRVDPGCGALHGCATNCRGGGIPAADLQMGNFILVSAGNNTAGFGKKTPQCNPLISTHVSIGSCSKHVGIIHSDALWVILNPTFPANREEISFVLQNSTTANEV